MSFEDQRLKFLRDIPIFAGVDIAAFEELASGMTEAAFESGEMVFREKDPGGEMFIIHSGAVEIIKHFGDKHETNLAVLGPRDFFGEMAIIESGARSATARSVKLTRLFCIKAEQLNRLFQRHPAQYAIIILNLSLIHI